MMTALHITPDMVPGLITAIVLLPFPIIVIREWVRMYKR